MRKALFAIAALGAMLSAPVSFASDDDYDAKCRRWAQEDEVKAEEMDEYLKQCIEDLRASAKEEKEPSEKAESEKTDKE